MNNEEKIYALLEKVYIDLQDTKKEMRTGFDNVYKEMRTGFDEVNEKIDEIKRTVVRIENDHGQKLGVLFDGYKLNAEKLDKIETELSKHEELIFKRIK